MGISTGTVTTPKWPIGNGLLNRVSPHEQAALMSYCGTVELRVDEILYQPDDPLTHVYFPLAGTASLIAVMRDGRAVETMTIGREGVIATSASGYVDPAFSRFMVQVPGTAVRHRPRVRGHDRRECRSMLREVLLRTTLQIVACNAVHSVRRRCGRWILITHDRSGSDLLPLTQASLAEMLA
jgi:hypothetical protein